MRHNFVKCCSSHLLYRYKYNRQLIMYLEIVLAQKNTRGTVNPADCFKFQVEDRVQCTQSNKVKYASRSEYCLSLPIPMEATTNKGTSLQANKKDWLILQSILLHLTM